MPSSSVVSSKSSIFGGIFTTEPGQRLLTITELLTKRGFEGLYEKCATNLTGNYYQTGLRRVHMWSDNVIDEDIDYVRGRCPDLDETYEACFVNYIAERYTGNQRPTINCPSIHTFVRRYLESVAQQDSITTGDFFATKDPLMRRITCMDATRSALYALVTAESLRIELASEVSARPTTTRQLSETRNVEQYRRTLEEDDVATEVKPEDSVSQVESVRSSRIVPPQRDPTPPRSREPPPPQRDTTPPRTREPPVPSVQRQHSPPPPPPPTAERLQIHSSARDDDDDSRSVTVISTRSARERRDEQRAMSTASSRHYPEEYRTPSRDETIAPSRHDFSIRDDEEEEVHRSRSPRESVASLRTRSVVGSASSSVSIGMKRLKSPRN